ncbi:sigma-70 family RNA polymerase sigma factor [Pigmentiphaga sp.]|uniref:RNA polymerase sigma factor n=1 Tax=Pigmentiphaga sp. TaxID=1977564 RepID=UPI00128D141C|nr:sigma-70 family RNA polymerase sigma factor [Pigmentiphaga sp.]MPS29347.1 sigma-70 family RNA polymerase sigma factor [Alcaligenaceae bacterium SAGV5]MPS55285.1 sigma-70 family RNA polymerase sigma factor [Alcaligenaceae bacterium SAGV3]MPT56644.1 sigma-70 family RNA polymerase sigma factor [Alcaligenaceae bacterium]
MPANLPDRAGATVPARSAALLGGRLQEVLTGNYVGFHKRLTRHLGCADLASESLHEAWLRLGGAMLVREPGNPQGYVFRVACNAAMDLLRADQVLRPVDGSTALEGVVDEAPGPERIAAARASVRALDRVCRGLPGRHQAILFALRIDEAPRQEVAARYGLSVRNVDTVLRQALRRCETELASTKARNCLHR